MPTIILSVLAVTALLALFLGVRPVRRAVVTKAEIGRRSDASVYGLRGQSAHRLDAIADNDAPRVSRHSSWRTVFAHRAPTPAADAWRVD